MKKANGSRFNYYYLRDSAGHPRITVCLAERPSEIGEPERARGMAICSSVKNRMPDGKMRVDVVNKEEGRMRARKRAVAALNSKMTKDPIDPLYLAWETIEMIEGWRGLDAIGFFNNKTVYNPLLTEHELRITNPKRPL
jgi:hypothetical protein